MLIAIRNLLHGVSVTRVYMSMYMHMYMYMYM